MTQQEKLRQLIQLFRELNNSKDIEDQIWASDIAQTIKKQYRRVPADVERAV